MNIIQVISGIHYHALDELVETVSVGLNTNHITHIAGSLEHIPHGILVGAHMLTSQECAAVDDSMIVYNSEHCNSHIRNHIDYLSMLGRCVVWDYSLANAAALSALLGKTVQFVPFGFVSTLACVPNTIEDIDVLFYGSINPRRQAVLNELSARGIVVHVVNNTYGCERDRLIARAKVVLNIHFYLPGCLEIMRVGFLLANSKAVVSECNDGEIIDYDLKNAAVFCPYELLVDGVIDLVRDSIKRQALAHHAGIVFRQRDEMNILRKALKASQSVVGPPSYSFAKAPEPVHH